MCSINYRRTYQFQATELWRSKSQVQRLEAVEVDKSSTFSMASQEIPHHIALIMDGNGRWASDKGKSPSDGHLAGVQALQTVVEESIRYGIPFLTVFAFSVENNERNHNEVSYLMTLIKSVLNDKMKDLLEEGVRLKFIGDRTGLSYSLNDAMSR